ncbi:MAG: hypothetical protein ABIF19_17480 [Planctomycetota bacterium]
MSTWPSDNLPRRLPFEVRPGTVNAYFLSPSESKYEIVEDCLRRALESACQNLGLTARLDRAVNSTSPVVIHDEIWNWLYNADILIFDITGENASVMMELGATAAWRLKPQVILLQDRDIERLVPFNLSPARILRYALTPHGMGQLQDQAKEAFQFSLSTLPIAEATRFPRKEILPFEYPRNSEHLISSMLCHRYQRPDGGLEFGAPYDFPHSFLLPHTGEQADLSVSSEMSFTNVDIGTNPNDYWIGIKLLSTGVLMNFGVGAVVYPNGKARITYTEGEKGLYKDPYFDEELPKIHPETDRVQFEAIVCKNEFNVRIQCNDKHVENRLDLGTDAKYRPTKGLCLLQAYRCRAVLWRLLVEPPP